jgi:hypothetical protein
MITTTTEDVAPVATTHRLSARDNDMDEETTETIVPAQPQTVTRTTTQTQQFQQQ